jgi:hypothetical protein
MEATRYSETSVHIRTTRHYIPEDSNIRPFSFLAFTPASLNWAGTVPFLRIAPDS